MSITKVNADVLDLTDGYAFTGTVTGAGSNIKEMLVMVCDGRARTVSSGTYTPQEVTAAQDTTTTYTDISGSVIAYTPPSGTTSVLYKFIFGMGYADSQAICHFKFFIDSDEVTMGRRSYGAATQIGTNYNYEWLVRIGDGTDTASGRVPSWSSSKTLKMQVRSYGTPQDAKMHGTTYWDGGGGSHVLVPTLNITALG